MNDKSCNAIYFLAEKFEQNNFLSIQVQKHSSALIENQWPYRRSARQDSNCLFTTFLQLVCSSSKKVQGSRFFLHVCVKFFFFAIIMQLCCSMLKWKTGLTGAMLGDILKAFPTHHLSLTSTDKKVTGGAELKWWFSENFLPLHL